MPTPVLWVCFLGDRTIPGAKRPTLWLVTGDSWRRLQPTDRVIKLLAAIAVPPDTAAGHGAARRQTSLGNSAGLGVWTASQVQQRAGYGSRQTVSEAAGALEQLLVEASLDPRDYLHRKGGYCLTTTFIDVLELAAHHTEDPAAVDAVLDRVAPNAQQANLGRFRNLWSQRAQTELSELLAVAAERRRVAAVTARTRINSPPPAVAAPADESTAGATEGPSTSSGRAALRLGLAAIAAALCVLVVAVVLDLGGRGGKSSAGERAHAGKLSRAAVLTATVRLASGGPARTWSDYRIAGGRRGPQLTAHATVDITCRTGGFVVDDGDRWWYLIATRPWNKRYWVTADAFYNRPGQRTGPLRGTPFYDPRVPVCP